METTPKIRMINQKIKRTPKMLKAPKMKTAQNMKKKLKSTKRLKAAQKRRFTFTATAYATFILEYYSKNDLRLVMMFIVETGKIHTVD